MASKMPTSNKIGSGPIRLPHDALWVTQGRLFIAGSPFCSYVDASEPELERQDTLLAIAFRRRLSPRHVGEFAKALQVSAGGDDALANLHIALAGSFRLEVGPDLVKQLLLADLLLAGYVGGHARSGDAGSGAMIDGALTKYDPEQPRVPRGSGATSGRWTASGSASEGSSIGAPTATTLVAGADSLFLPELSAAALSALSAFAASIGFAAVLGTLFVPSSNSVSSSGVLPGPSGATYDYDHDEGALRIVSRTGVLLAAGSRDKDGVFTDARTGFPFAREVNGALVFDGDAVREADDAGAVPGAVSRPDTDQDQPKLCPDPSADKAGSGAAKQRAREYQEQISRMINPDAPLTFGMAVVLADPLTGNPVHYDDCNRRTGAMIEAKGPGYADLLGFAQANDSIDDDWLRQSLRQTRAARERSVEWYFAEQEAADHARSLFVSEKQGREHIVIKVVPAVKP